ncbi:MAG: DUF7619 domain-containing protein [Aureispira sp.]
MRVTIILWWALLLSASLQAQITLIPDTNFEQALINQNIDTDGLINGQILTSDAQAITTLDVKSSNINDLTGIADFVNLTSLDVGYNNISNLDVSALINLTFLDFDNNNVSTIDISTLVNLTGLVTQANNLTALDVSNNPLLTRLGCNVNNISVLDISNNPLLRDITCGGNNISTLDVSHLANLSSFNCDGSPISTIDLSHNPNLSFVFIRSNNLDFLYLPHGNINYINAGSNPSMVVCMPDTSVVPAMLSSPNWTFDNTVTWTEACWPIVGQFAVDMDFDCVLDSGEIGWEGQLVRMTEVNSGQVRFTTTDNEGYFKKATTDSGTYMVELMNLPYWQGCGALQGTIGPGSSPLEFSLQAMVQCPYLTVDIGAPFLRTTNGGSSYTVSYCNTGTANAYGAFAEVLLDPSLTYVNATAPLLSQVGNTYTFNLDSVLVGECSDFTINVVVDTQALPGQTHCTEVHIHPDTNCQVAASFPVVDGTTTCLGDSVRFVLRNVGTANMAQGQPYTIIQDDIAMRTGTIQLNAGQATTITYAADPGKTYRIEVNQAANLPRYLGDFVYSSFIEGCNPRTDGSFNTGFATQYSNGLRQHFRAIDCQANVASYDPNDKAAQPIGYDSAHYIYDHTPIDYKIRFQNTGTDTAFNIYILDTLSTYFDVSTLQMGASSHTYTWQILAGNVLRVDFNNIMLPDSNVNEPLSNGFFRYRIEQTAWNPLGSVIYNQAAIYFDFNPPIFTNTTFHTIGDKFVEIGYINIDKVPGAEMIVRAYPNPFRDLVTIEVDGEQFKSLELIVYDLLGQQVAYRQIANSNQIQLTRANLQQGIYVYKLIGDQEEISTGKISVQ